MTDETGKPRPWDLDQYHVKARTERQERQQANPEEATEFERRHKLVGRLGEDDEDDPALRLRGALQDDHMFLEPGEEKTRARYVNSGELFWKAFLGSMLTILTLGLYRFWMITALRRLYCNSIRVDNDPIEYTGTGFEKFIGFLIAITILAIYLGLANILLLFVGIVSLQEHSLLVPFSALAALPFLFWASYRSQRYIMARLKWRGIRFGLMPGSWGYMARSLLWSVAVVLTLGFLWPYMHFKQAKYIADRSRFGDLEMRQDGSWLGLLTYWIWVYIAMALLFLFGWGIAEEMRLNETGVGIMFAILLPIAMVIFFLLSLNYQIGSFRYLWDNRRIGEARLNNDVRFGPYAWRYVKGSFLVGLLSTIIIGVIFLILFGFLMAAGLVSPEQGLVFAEGNEQNLSEEEIFAMLPLAIVVIVAYLSAFAISYSLSQIFIVQPLLALKVEAMLIRNPLALRDAAQRPHDQAAEAGGFADALGVDMGAGFG